MTQTAWERIPPTSYPSLNCDSGDQARGKYIQCQYELHIHASGPVQNNYYPGLFVAPGADV